MAASIPSHLLPFVVEQPYESYSAVDHAVWRYVMRQNVAFHRDHAHPVYLEGLRAAGIGVEEIPRLEHMNEALSRFGWSAVAVDGFIPPAAFMEFQARGILPIACDIRTLEHLSYTPAPDIIHESAGHAPILREAEFTAFVQTLCELGRQAPPSAEDDALYEAIRHLSILKETPSSTAAQIRAAEERLASCQSAIRTVSPANMVSRLYWWTVEYGLIGDPARPRIYGAGLLSSVGESQRVFTDAVSKLPFDLDACIETPYDITSYQPQLFVCRNFAELTAAVRTLAARLGISLERPPHPVEDHSLPPRPSKCSPEATPDKAYPDEQIGVYQALRDLRKADSPAAKREARLADLAASLERYPGDWLMHLEWLELAYSLDVWPERRARVRDHLLALRLDAALRPLIDNGLALCEPPLGEMTSRPLEQA